MKYRIAFAQWYYYDVEADNENEAIEQAEDEFCSDMRSPIANIVWDEMHAYTLDEDENEIAEVASGYN